MRQEVRRARLSDDEIRAFTEVGWITRGGLFDADEVGRMRACFDRLEAIAAGIAETGMRGGSYFVLGTKQGVRVIERVVWAGASQRYLLTVASDPRLTIPCAQLLRSEAMDHLLSQAHFKRPRDGVMFDWHQDIEHRDKGDGTWTDINGYGSFVQTVIVLDEMTPDNGPMLFIPGSSKWGRVSFADRDAGGSCRAVDIRTRLSREAVMIAASPGDTLFFGPYTVHGSFENRSDRYRRVLINGYASPGANHRSYPGDGAGRRLTVPAAYRPRSSTSI
jgi:ectoine hydroxylase-related dioxygenase (phytanoyl-CoA dioxygenase family)